MSEITFYTDTSKQKEFIERLNLILSKEDSSVKNCYLTYDYNNRLVLYLSSFKDPKYVVAFNFHMSFTREPKENPDCFTSILRQGFSLEDANLLYDLFEEFTLTNGAESQFFASKFIELSGYKDNFSRYVFKFTEDFHENRFIIDGLKLTRSYAYLRKEDLLRFLIDNKSNENSELTAINEYSIVSDDTKEQSIQKMTKFNQHKPDDEYIVVELYKDFEKRDRYIKDIIYQLNDKLITNNFKKFR